MLSPSYKLWNKVRTGFENEFSFSPHDAEAKKMIEREMSFLCDPKNSTLADVVARISCVLEAFPNQAIVLEEMNRLILTPYLLGLSTYNPFDAENCRREEPVMYHKNTDMSLHTSMEGFEVIFFSLYAQLERRVMLTVDDTDSTKRYIIVAPQGMEIPDYYTPECDIFIPQVKRNGGIIINITINKIIDNYERLTDVFPFGCGYHLKKAVYALITIEDIDIWAGVTDSNLLRDIARRHAPNSLRDMVECLQDYYCDNFSQTLYIQLANIIIEMMCIHLEYPGRFFDVLIGPSERAILDTFEDVEIMDMFWDSLMREKANRGYYRTLKKENRILMAHTAEKYRDELLLCSAYIDQE